MSNDLLSQDEIDSVLQQAQIAVAQLADSAGLGAGPQPNQASPSAMAQGPGLARTSARLRRLLRLRVPLIVRLAKCKMPVNEILQWDRGTIVEFDKTVGAELDLMVNNQCIGHGEAVKVGENFGLRISRLVSPQRRIQSMGGQH